MGYEEATSKSSDGFALVTLVSADASTEADFAPGANMVCCSLRHGGREFLHIGDGLAAYAQTGATMGIPLLHPWANRLESLEYRALGKHVVLPSDERVIPNDHAGHPIHGVQPALMHWEVQQSRAEELEATMPWSSPDLLGLFPFPHEVRLAARIARGTLEITTTVHPTADDPVPVLFGYHPYLRIPDSSRTTWLVEIGAFRRLELDTRLIPTGVRTPVERRELELDELSFDDAFDALAVPARFSATGNDVQIAAEFLSGYSYAQIYAPPGKDFICFEPMTAPTNALNSGDGMRVVGPGEEYRAEFKISVSDRHATDVP